MLREALLLSTLFAALLGGGTAQALMPLPPDPKPVTAGQDKEAAQAPDTVLAEASGLELTFADADAYVDALIFSLAHAGQDPARLAADRATVREHLADSFQGLPEAAQIDLADMTGIWAQARQTWENLSATEKNAFSYGVLALAFGEDEAGQILRWDPRRTMIQSTAPLPGTALEQGQGIEADLDCIMTGNCDSGGVHLPN